MTLKIVDNNIFDLDVEVMVNPVNTRGVMGKGLAFQFKNKYFDMFKQYRELYLDGELAIGKLFIYETNKKTNPKYIVNFPTKEHWGDLSEIRYIEKGIPKLIEFIENSGIKSIAIPALGCGCGGLEWKEVKPLLYNSFCNLSKNIDIYLVKPSNIF
jgi:O-acetyl-ADP-ribose deacetylase (regulator of RNase III)